jgi:GT2 family glycosyltransferase
MDRRVGIVIATRDRCGSLLRTLDRLQALDERPPVVLVDNGSADGTPKAVRARFPDVDVVALPRDRGAAARNLGMERLACPYVAFCDDDSWWAPGALARAADELDADPRLAVLAARVLVGEDDRLDPVCAEMANSPLGRLPGAAGPSVLGFVACGAVVRREAVLAVGGFDERYGIGGEEQPLALDLAAAGWRLAYVEDVVAHHHPARGPRPGRVARQIRNDLWSAWLRRPAAAALATTLRIAAGALRRPGQLARGLAQALAGTGWVLQERRVQPASVERSLRLLSRPRHPS